MKYSLVYFIESFHPNIGGAEVRAYHLLSRIRNFEVNLYTINFGYGEYEELNGIKIKRILNVKKERYFRGDGRNLIVSYKFAKEVKRILKKEEFHVYVFDQFPYIHFTLSSKLLEGKKTIVQIHEVLKGYFRNPLKERMLEYVESRMFKLPDYDVVTSTLNAEILSKSYGIPPEKIIVIPNGVSPGKKTKGDGGVIYVGRNTKDKNIKGILDLAGMLRDIKFTLVTPAQVNMENVIVKSNLSEEELHHDYSSSRLFVTASLREGFSIASLEAMAHGLPVIYLRTPLNKAMEYIVRDGETGYGCSSLEEMAVRIRELFRNDSEWERLSNNAYEFSRNFLWENISRKYEEFLLSVVSK